MVSEAVGEEMNIFILLLVEPKAAAAIQFELTLHEATKRSTPLSDDRLQIYCRGIYFIPNSGFRFRQRGKR